MTSVGMSSGMARTVVGGWHRRSATSLLVEAPEATPVEQQRAALAYLHGHHVTGDQLVVAAVEDVAQAALNDGQRMVDHWRSRDAVGPPDAFELVAARDGEGAAERLLMFAEDVHAEGAGLGDAGPARRAAGRGENDHRRIEGEGGEGLAAEADGYAVLQCRDDGDPGGEVAEHLAEPGLVEARCHHGS
jgi:hypothetical protein